MTYNNIDNCYKDVITNILDNGKFKSPDRVIGGFVAKNDTIGLPNIHLDYDMNFGFPLVTSKRVPIKSTAVELEGFINGITSKRWYQDRNCKFWNEWANPIKVKKKLLPKYALQDSIHEYEEKQWLEEAQTQEDDLGAVYGYQWRRFDEQYGSIDGHSIGYEWKETPNGVAKGFDQLKYVIDTLVTKPNDRRMYVSAWNPNQIQLQALPACHLGWGVTLYDNKLNLCFIMRSVDMVRGWPVNIASYGLLLKLLSKHSGFECGILSCTLIDCHIYLNQIDGIKQQIQEPILKIPTVKVLPEEGFKFWEWTHKDLEINYEYSKEKFDLGDITV
jgi:thymidylate synthase